MRFLGLIGSYVFPILLLAVPAYAHLKGVKVYEVFVEGAKEGLSMTESTLPYLVAIFAGIACLRGSLAFDYLSRGLAAVLKPLGVPAEIIPLIAIRPLSGSGALAVTSDILRVHGPDSPLGLLASIVQGATDTTFYVVTLYFGSVKVRKSQKALLSGLFGDLCGFIAAFAVWRLMMN